jgi:hypothetical protein
MFQIIVDPTRKPFLQFTLVIGMPGGRVYKLSLLLRPRIAPPLTLQHEKPSIIHKSIDSSHYTVS